MRVIISVMCDSPAFAVNDAAELGSILQWLMRHIELSHRSLEGFDEPLFLRDSHGDVVGRMTVTADPE